MGQIQSYTDEEIVAIESDMVTGGIVVGDDLVFSKRDGTTINTGSVRGPQGDPSALMPLLYSATSSQEAYVDPATWGGVIEWTFTEGDPTLFVYGEYTDTPDVWLWDSWFTVQKTGTYLANFSYTFSMGYFEGDPPYPQVRMLVAFWVNNVQDVAYQNFGPTSSNSALSTIQVTAIMSLTAGQKVSPRVYNGGASYLNPSSPYAKVNFLKID